MPTMDFPEKDWKLFRKKMPDWQENYMDRLNQEYLALLTGEGKPSDKFWALSDRLKNDKKHKGVIARMSRSEMFFNIVSLINEGAIEFDDLKDFSQDLQDSVSAFTDRNFLEDN